MGAKGSLTFPLSPWGKGMGAAIQSRHNEAGVSRGTMAPDGEGWFPSEAGDEW